MTARDAIMAALERVGTPDGCNRRGGNKCRRLLSSIKQTMAELTEQQAEDMRISGILAADTFAATKVEGALAGEHTMENVVMLAAMVKTSHLHMNRIARELQTRIQIPVVVSGKEAEMALKGH